MTLETKIRLALMLSLVVAILASATGVVDVNASGATYDLQPIDGVWQATADVVDDVGDELAESTPYENWQIILGFLMPVAVEFFRGLQMTDRQKTLLSFGLTAGVTAFGMFLQGQLTADLDVIATVLKVFVATIAAYYGVWKPLGLAGKTTKTYGLK